MVNSGTQFPVRSMRDIRLPVRVVGEIDWQRHRNHSEHRWKDQTFTCVPIDESITDEDTDRLLWAVGALDDLVRGKRVLASE